MEETLILREKVTIRDFGRFEARTAAPTRRRVPKTGELVEIPSKETLSFSVSPELKKRLNRNRGNKV
jgi:nucleoid DNA-binding protein